MALEIYLSPWQEVSSIFCEHLQISTHYNQSVGNIPTLCISVVIMVTFVMSLLNIADLLSPVHDLDSDGHCLLYIGRKLHRGISFCPLFFLFHFSFPVSPTLFSSDSFSVIFLPKFSDLSCSPLWRIATFCIPEDSNSLCMSAGQQHWPLPLTCVAYAN